METDIESLEKGKGFERAEWPVLRVGWVAMGIFLLVGAFGFMGSGPASKQTSNTAGLTVQYEQYLRYSVQSEIIVEVPELGADSSLWINSDYIDKVSLVSVNPEPVSMDQENGFLRLRFSSRSPQKIRLSIQPQRGGRQELEIKNGANKGSFSQFVYL